MNKHWLYGAIANTLLLIVFVVVAVPFVIGAAVLGPSTLVELLIALAVIVIVPTVSIIASWRLTRPSAIHTRILKFLVALPYLFALLLPIIQGVSNQVKSNQLLSDPNCRQVDGGGIVCTLPQVK